MFFAYFFTRMGQGLWQLGRGLVQVKCGPRFEFLCHTKLSICFSFHNTLFERRTYLSLSLSVSCFLVHTCPSSFSFSCVQAVQSKQLVFLWFSLSLSLSLSSIKIVAYVTSGKRSFRARQSNKKYPLTCRYPAGTAGCCRGSTFWSWRPAGAWSRRGWACCRSPSSTAASSPPQPDPSSQGGEQSGWRCSDL